MDMRVWVDGASLWTAAPWSDLEYELNIDGGSDVASVSLVNVTANLVPGGIQRGKSFTITFGTLPVWAGTVSEYDRDTATIHAVGLFRSANNGQGRGYLALDASSNPTSVPDTAVSQAVSRGLPWKYQGDFSTSAYASTTSAVSLNYLSELLDAVATSNGQHWGVDADGVPYMRTPDTTPSWYLSPGMGGLGTADDNFVTHLYGRRVSALSGSPAIPSAWATDIVGDDNAAAIFGRSEASVDLTSLGLISSASSTGILQGMLNKSGARMGYITAVTASSLELRNLGGTRGCLPLVRTGQMIRCFGASDGGAGTTFGSTVDFVVGRVRYKPAEDSIYIEPVGLAARDLQNILTAPAPVSAGFTG